MSVEAALRHAMHKAGLAFAGPIVPDGELHRFRVHGDHDQNSWYVLHTDPPTAAAFGCWKRGFKETWCERNGQLSQAERNAVRHRWQEAHATAHKAETERHANAREDAAAILAKTCPANGNGYLAHKGVKAFGKLRQSGGTLVVPLGDMTGTLHSLQFIEADGTKKFLPGGKVTACFFTVAERPDAPLVVCEGYATGASIHESAGHAVICAMNCGNLPAVAQAFRTKFPTREIIIAADNDQWTTGNPGVTKATEAAKASGAKLAVPQFQDTTTKPTDYNDLHQLEGLDTVKTQFESASAPKESDEEILERLAALPPLEFDRCATKEAKAMGVNVGTLRSEVEKRRPKQGDPKLQGRASDFADLEPWPEAVDGGNVLDDIAKAYSRYVALPDGAADALALWTAHAHGFEIFLCSPRLNISSPDKGCGKTTLRDVVAVLVPRPLVTENLSVAVLFRLIQAHSPTVLADEYDTWLRDNDELRGLLNAGHRRGAFAYRCEGENHDVRGFCVFAPAVLCGIGSLPGTLHDRSIVIRLERAKPGELRARFDSRHVDYERELCRKLARWCADNRTQLEACDPVLPSNAVNRLADNWRPLFAVAEVASGDWPQRAKAAYAKLTSREDTDAQGIGTMLLADIRQAFVDGKAERIFSKTLTEALCRMTDRPWPEAHRGKPISEAWLARRLQTFRVSPKTLRIADDRAKGYEVADFAEAFERYLSSPGFPNRDSRDNSINTGVPSPFQSVTTPKPVTAPKPHETIANNDLSRCHALSHPAEETEPADELIL